MFRYSLHTAAYLAVLTLVAISGTGIAASPTLDALHPPGMRVGTAAQITAVGKLDPWPLEIRCSNPHLSFKADPKKKGSYTVTAAKEAQVGPCLVHLYNKEGSSGSAIFTLGTLPEIAEQLDKKGKESNNSNSTAQAIKKLPITLNGRLDKSEDVDIYRMTLKKGQTFIASAEAYGLKSPIDPYLHLYDPDGTLIKLGNDNGTNLDPLLIHKVLRDGSYTLAIMGYIHPPGSDIRFTGKANAVYRLTLTTGPWLSHALPLSVKESGNTALKLFGYNLPDNKAHLPLNFTNQNTHAETAVIRHPAFPNQLSLAVTSSAPTSLSKDSEIKIPAAATGQLSKSAETDRITITAKKGQKLDIRVSSRRFGFPLDPVLIIQDAKGKELKRVDDGNVKTDRDAKVVWAAPADGKYTLLISDLFRKGGPLYHYLLTVSEAQPTFSATADKTSYTVDSGKTADVKIKITRLNGHKVPLKIETKNLPPGITIVPPKEIPNKTADITIKIKAGETAAAANQTIRLVLKETSGDSPKSQTVQFSFLPIIPGGPYLLNQANGIWLTVKAKPKTKKPDAKAKAKKPAPKKAPKKPETKPKPKPKPVKKPDPKKKNTPKKKN